MAVIMHYLFLAVFCWMLCQGLLLYMLLVIVFDSGKTYRRRYFALGWGKYLLAVDILETSYIFLLLHTYMLSYALPV